MSLVTGILLALLTGCVGFILGSIKFFREEKQKAYRESLPPILKMAYGPGKTEQDEQDFNKAMAKFCEITNEAYARAQENND